MKLYFYTFVYMFKYLFSEKNPGDLGRAIKALAEKMGLTYVKFGQILSTREDILPAKECEPLRELLNKHVPMSYEEIEKIIINNFGKKPEDIFKYFNKNSLGVASVAQVHKATLKNGKVVAVKIKRPGVDKKIGRDVKQLKGLLNFACFFNRKVRYLGKAKLVDQMAIWLIDDVDFIKQVENIKIVNKIYGDKTKIRKDLGAGILYDTYPEYCTDEIITMDFVEGFTLNNIPEENLGEYDVLKSLKTLICTAFRSLMVDSEGFYYQGDPHPANIMVGKNGQVCNIDCGMIFHLTKGDTKIVKNLILDIYFKRLDKFKESIMMLVEDGFEFKSKEDEERFDNILNKFLVRSEDATLGEWFKGMLKIFVDYELPIPLYLVEFARTYIILDGTIMLVDKNLTAFDILRPEFEIEVQKEAQRYATEIPNIVKKSIAAEAHYLLKDGLRTYAENSLKSVTESVDEILKKGADKK